MIDRVGTFMFSIVKGGFTCLVPIFVVLDPKSLLFAVDVAALAPLKSICVIGAPIPVLFAIDYFTIYK